MIGIALVIWTIFFWTANLHNNRLAAKTHTFLMGLSADVGLFLVAYDRNSLLDYSIAGVVALALVLMPFVLWNKKAVRAPEVLMNINLTLALFAGAIWLIILGIMSFIPGSPHL